MAKHLFYCINADSNNCSMQTFVFTSQNLEQNRYCLNILIIVGANYYKSLLYTVQKCIKSTKNPAKKKKARGKTRCSPTKLSVKPNMQNVIITFLENKMKQLCTSSPGLWTWELWFQVLTDGVRYPRSLFWFPSILQKHEAGTGLG